jgi:CubicO group peptidase (beta-lactamase class C family)
VAEPTNHTSDRYANCLCIKEPMKQTSYLIFSILFALTWVKGNTQDLKGYFNEMTSFIEQERKDYNIPSVVVGITDSDTIIYLESFGEGTRDDIYLIGSNSKSFTAYAILILQENGGLDIDEPVLNHLPWFKYKDPKQSEEVKIRDLLNHTSGIPREFGMHEPKVEADIQKFYSGLVQKIIPENPVGEYYEYSNLNYQLLGLIIEKVSKTNYSDFLKKSIFQPMGLISTYATFIESEQNGLKESRQYLLYFPLIMKSKHYSNYVVPSGFISSTASDMCSYLRYLLNSQTGDTDPPYRKNITNQLFMSRSDINSNYGMGWEVRKWKDYQRFKHDGLTQSFSSSMLILPEIGLGIIVMVNINNSSSTLNIADGILRILSSNEKVEYSKAGFYLRNSLPLFALWVLIILVIRMNQWIKQKFPVGINMKILPNIWLSIGILFGLFWIIYFPIVFNTPLSAIIDYEPNSGYSLLVLTIGIILNSIIGYFLRLKGTLPNMRYVR